MKEPKSILIEKIVVPVATAGVLYTAAFIVGKVSEKRRLKEENILVLNPKHFTVVN